MVEWNLNPSSLNNSTHIFDPHNNLNRNFFFFFTFHQDGHVNLIEKSRT